MSKVDLNFLKPLVGTSSEFDYEDILGWGFFVPLTGENNFLRLLIWESKKGVCFSLDAVCLSYVEEADDYMFVKANIPMTAYALNKAKHIIDLIRVKGVKITQI